MTSVIAVVVVRVVSTTVVVVAVVVKTTCLIPTRVPSITNSALIVVPCIRCNVG